jgi:hypothetical protein
MQQLLPLMAKSVMHHATIVAFDDKCMTMGVGGEEKGYWV